MFVCKLIFFLFLENNVYEKQILNRTVSIRDNNLKLKNNNKLLLIQIIKYLKRSHKIYFEIYI